MPRRTDISTLCLIGAGPIIIGQACEFDYSGTQALRALREEGYRLVLVNSNPATIMTDPELADATYIEPLTVDSLACILRKERPDAILPTVGGQTALNLALALERQGILKDLGIGLIGANAEVIERAENRQRFCKVVEAIGLETPRSQQVSSLAEAEEFVAASGFPVVLRPSFTLGGSGGGVAFNRDEFERLIARGLRTSPVSAVLIEESVIGWKEFEMEVVRDSKDNCIIVCAIENIDPMGVHTGDSVTVAPALTLSDKEYQVMRDSAMAVVRAVGVDTGGANVQFAVNPQTGKQLVIEMNPRVSRSSALASKATGFPIARVAAKLAVGYSLDELPNEITRTTPASFEPALDYVVVKVPRFAFEKFSQTEPVLTTAMRSVGEAMAIGRCFEEAMQKALYSLERDLTGFDEMTVDRRGQPLNKESLKHELATPSPDRILYVAQACREGLPVTDICRLTRIDPWFIRRIADLVTIEQQLRQHGLPGQDQAAALAGLKKLGFSDARLARLLNKDVGAIFRQRQKLGVIRAYNQIDTCAAEFRSFAAYYYGTFGAAGRTARPLAAAKTARDKVIILGSGPNRIGQGIEFDYCCVHAAMALRELGYETIMINSNPETVSTDFDTSDRLYFEPLTAESVIAVVAREQDQGNVRGVIVQYGGQTPLRLTRMLAKHHIPVLGTQPASIHIAEDRAQFQTLLQKLAIPHPAYALADTIETAEARAMALGFPLVVRPSYVLGGRAMQIVHNGSELKHYLHSNVTVLEQSTGEGAILLDRFLVDAIEVDVDAIADGDTVYIAGIIEHIEAAGIHSGDSAGRLPPQQLSETTIATLKSYTRAIVKGLKIVGLINIQFAIVGPDIFCLEVNPRASRTVPFVAKITGVPIAKIAAKVMAGQALADFNLGEQFYTNRHAVKESVFPFNKIPAADAILGPEMRSTGEVMGIDDSPSLAFVKAQAAAGNALPATGQVFISVTDRDKPRIIALASSLAALNFRLIATLNTAAVLNNAGLTVSRINKMHEGSPHIVDAIANGAIDLVIITRDSEAGIRDSANIRVASITHNVPYCTTLTSAQAAVTGLACQRQQAFSYLSLQEHIKGIGR